MVNSERADDRAKSFYGRLGFAQDSVMSIKLR